MTGQSYFQNINSQTLDKYEFQENFSKFQIPSIKVGKEPNYIAVNEKTNKVYVTNGGSNTLSIVDINKMSTKEIRVGSHPVQIYIDTSTGYVYVINDKSDSISIIDGYNDSKIKDIVVGGDIKSFARDELNHRIYIAYLNSDIDSSLRKSGTVLVYDGFNFTKIGQFGGGEEILDIDVLESDFTGDFMSPFPTSMLYALNSTHLILFELLNYYKLIVIPVGENAFNMYMDDLYSYKAYIEHSSFTNEPFISVLDLTDTLGLNIIEINGSLLNPNISDRRIYQSSTYSGGEDISDFNAISNYWKYLYIKNEHNNTVSVFSKYSLDKTNEISFKNLPNNIAGTSNWLYFADPHGDIILFDTNHMERGKITTGSYIPPQSMTENSETRILYTLYYDSGKLSAIQGLKIFAGVSFDIKPSNSGYISCNSINFPTNKYLFVDIGTKCIAEPNKKFEFNSWSENLGKSTRTLNVSTFTESPFHPILNVLGLENNDSSKIFTVNDYGNFTANFIEVTPPIPNEYLFPLYGIIVSTIIGWSIPSIIGWIKTRTDVRKLNYFHKKIFNLYGDGKLDDDDIDPLNKLKITISDAYAKGQINSEHYSNLKHEMSVLYQEIFNKKIDSLKDFHDSEVEINKIDLIKHDLNDAFSKEKLNEKHYNLLKERILELDKNNKGNNNNDNK